MLSCLLVFGYSYYPGKVYANEDTQNLYTTDLENETFFQEKQYDRVSLQQEIENIFAADIRQKGILSDIALDSLAELLYSIVFSSCTDFIWDIVGWGNISTSGPYGYLKEDGVSWLKKADVKDIYINVKDWGYLLSFTKLHASYIQNGNSKKTVVIQHGYRGPTESVGVYAKMFYDMGYNVLLPDSRATGQSNGTKIAFGWREKDDILQWITQVPVNQEIILMGESMGAATMMMTSGMTKLPKNVKAIISDSGYASLDQQIQFLYNKVNELVNGKIPQKVLTLLDKKVKIRLKFQMSEVSSLNQVAKSEIPMLFIHGENDTFVPSYMAKQIYDIKSNGEKQLFIVPEANHTQAISYSYPEYKEKIEVFIKRFIK